MFCLKDVGEIMEWSTCVDSLNLFSYEQALAYSEKRPENFREFYYDGDCFDYRMNEQADNSFHEVVKLNDDFVMLFSQGNSPSGTQYQTVTDGDWIHIQVRLRGTGHEEFQNGTKYDTPDHSCIILRHPENMIIKRTTNPEENWKVACLYMRPSAIQNFCGVPTSSIPKKFSWIADNGEWGTRLEKITLPFQAALVVNELFKCSFQSAARRSFMRAKSIELFSITANSLFETNERPTSSVKLTSHNLNQISLVHDIIRAELETPSTLEDLARRVGLSRTKLVTGFLSVYGQPLQSYWRDLRLIRAFELLTAHELTVTEVALEIGYDDLSSLSRAFVKKFGILPKDCRQLNNS
ncbi:helix-turn-helix domain-containing protein [Paremcibacter congregatus]|nr:AraC family transcriptional regulator [Paremcibacter congregatus]